MTSGQLFANDFLQRAAVPLRAAERWDAMQERLLPLYSFVWMKSKTACYQHPQPSRILEEVADVRTKGLLFRFLPSKEVLCVAAV